MLLSVPFSLCFPNITLAPKFHPFDGRAKLGSMVEGVLDESKYVALYRGNIIPLNACLPGLTWVLHDYLITIEDEVRHVWPHRMNLGKALFLWIRYYGILLLFFDVVQIHVFSIPGITSDTLCVAMDSIIRIVGALSLWAIEIVMQMRIYALYKCSRKIALINFVLFLGSIAAFLWILIFNAIRRRSVIAEAIHYPLPGCPSIHSGIEWIQWIPATVFESILFFWAVYKTLRSTAGRWRKGSTISLYQLILRDNVLYFFGITCLLIFNNLMVVGVTKIPWFSYSPFHAAMEIMTSRLLINLYKISNETVQLSNVEGKRQTTGYSGETMTVFAAAKPPLDSKVSGDLELQ